MVCLALMYIAGAFLALLTQNGYFFILCLVSLLAVSFGG